MGSKFEAELIDAGFSVNKDGVVDLKDTTD
jgi:hypothetical protein